MKKFINVIEDHDCHTTIGSKVVNINTTEQPFMNMNSNRCP